MKFKIPFFSSESTKKTESLVPEVKSDDNAHLREGPVFYVGTKDWSKAITKFVENRENRANIAVVVRDACQEYKLNYKTIVRMNPRQDAFNELVEILGREETDSALALATFQTFLMKGHRAANTLLKALMTSMVGLVEGVKDGILTQLKDDIIIFIGKNAETTSAKKEASEKVSEKPNKINVFLKSEDAKLAAHNDAISACEKNLPPQAFFYVDEDNQLQLCHGNGQFETIPWSSSMPQETLGRQRGHKDFSTTIAEHIQSEWYFYKTFLKKVSLFYSVEQASEAAKKFSPTINVALAYETLKKTSFRKDEITQGKWVIHVCHPDGGSKGIVIPFKSDLSVLFGEPFRIWPRLTEEFLLEHIPFMPSKGTVLVGVSGDILHYAGCENDDKVRGQILLTDISPDLKISQLRDIKILKPYYSKILARIHEQHPGLITDQDLDDYTEMQKWVESYKVSPENTLFPDSHAHLSNRLHAAVASMVEDVIHQTTVVIATSDHADVSTLRSAFWLDLSSGQLWWCGANEKQEIHFKENDFLNEAVKFYVEQYQSNQKLKKIEPSDYFKRLLLKVEPKTTKVAQKFIDGVEAVYQPQKRAPVCKLDPKDERRNALRRLLDRSTPSAVAEQAQQHVEQNVEQDVEQSDAIRP